MTMTEPHDQDETGCCTAQRFRTEILMGWRLVRDPELRALHRKLRHDRPAVLDLKQFAGTERRLVEGHGIGSPPHRKHRREADGGVV